MYTIHVIATDLFDLSVDDEPIKKEDLLELTASMHTGQFLRFKITNETTTIFEDSYLKFDEMVTLESFFNQKLKQLIKQKRLSKKESVQLKNFLFAEETAEIKLTNQQPKTKKSEKKEEVQSPISDTVVQEKRDRKKELQTFSLPFTRKNINIFMFIFIFMCIGSVFFFTDSYQVIMNYIVTSDTVSEESFLRDLKKVSPKDIGRMYPNRLDDIVEYYLSEGDFHSLKAFHSVYPTENATFDLAFYAEEWEELIELNMTQLSEERQVMLAHAYIELNQLEEAELLNQRLNSSIIATELDNAFVKQGIDFLQKKQLDEAKNLLSRIHNPTTKEVFQEYIDNASIMIDFIQLYQEKKDSENQELWERKLKKLGVEKSA